jgi:hypothetical protein
MAGSAAVSHQVCFGSDLGARGAGGKAITAPLFKSPKLRRLTSLSDIAFQQLEQRPQASGKPRQIAQWAFSFRHLITLLSAAAPGSATAILYLLQLNKRDSLRQPERRRNKVANCV